MNASLSQIFSDEEETQPPSRELFSKADAGSQGHGSQGSGRGSSQGSVQGQRLIQESCQTSKEVHIHLFMPGITCTFEERNVAVTALFCSELKYK